MVLTDIIKMVENLANVLNDKLSKNGLDKEFDFTNIQKPRTSIAKKSKTAILQFPILASRNISDYDILLTINKALERQYSVFIRTASGLDNEIWIDTDEDINQNEFKKEYIEKRLHQNLVYAEYPIKQIANDSIRPTVSKDNAGNYSIDTSSFKDNLVSSAISQIFESTNIELLKIYKNDLNYKSLNEANNKGKNNPPPQKPKPFGNRDILGDLSFKYDKQLVDNDVKKSNELVPTLVTIPIRVSTNRYTYQDTILLGIKAVIHPIDTDDMVYNISESLREKRKLFRFIQWTTGEISFFKDYLFCLDRIKKEAIQHNRKDKIWRALKVRASKDRLRRMTGKKGDFLPNATILLTMEEVEYILNEYGIDLVNNIGAVKQLFEIYFLLGLAIYDNSNNLVYFIFDGQNSYQALPLSALERENATKINDVKAITSLMNK